MKKLFIPISILAVIVFTLMVTYVADARSGCCSHHGGVCGCGCCDGTSLSAKCAPYYPECNSTSSYETPSYQPAYRQTYTAPVVHNCPTNSAYNSIAGSCECNTGYAVYKKKNSCVKVPANAHATETATEAWACDTGFKETKGACVVEQKQDDCEVDGFKTKVADVVDGDTISFMCNGKRIKIRITGIDTPEVVDPRKTVQCFGKEASKKMKELATGKEITLWRSKVGDNKDKYGRLLRYINLGGYDLGLKMISEGYAFSYKAYPHDKLEKYNSAEKNVMSTSKGLWNPDICNYKKS
jgi:micrococcal nuclease